MNEHRSTMVQKRALAKKAELLGRIGLVIVGLFFLALNFIAVGASASQKTQARRPRF